MDAGSTWFQKEIERRIRDIAEDRTNALLANAAYDFADYRHRVGYLQALGDVLAICESVEDDANKRGMR